MLPKQKLLSLVWESDCNKKGIKDSLSYQSQKRKDEKKSLIQYVHIHTNVSVWNGTISTRRRS